MAEPIPNVNLEKRKQTIVNRLQKILPVILMVLVVGLGVVTGYFLSSKKAGSGIKGGVIPKEALVKGSEFGVKDAKAFKDNAIGVVEAGGLDGEGSHKLLREGGPSQTVYLTSSILDLDQFIGIKVQIWGETFKAQKAGWLMDVGKVKVLD